MTRMLFVVAEKLSAPSGLRHSAISQVKMEVFCLITVLTCLDACNGRPIGIRIYSHESQLVCLLCRSGLITKMYI